MVNFLLFFILIATSQPVLSWDLNLLWKTKVEHPTLVTACENRLWVFARNKKVISKLNLNTGAVEKQMATSELPVALACFNEKLVVASQGMARWPIKGRLRDFHCMDRICGALIENDLFVSEDLKNWKRLELPLSPLIQDRDSDIKLNPFAHWQESLSLSTGAYSRLRITQRFFFLLDPVRNKVVVVSRDLKELVKWGRWGAWEGSLMGPRSLEIVQDQYVLILDATLKTIFAYSKDGEFIQTLKSKGQLPPFEYPADVKYFDEKLFVIDVFSNLIFAFKWARPVESASRQPVRENLFRRKVVLKDRYQNRCLKCHDGFVSDQWDKYFKNSHPIDNQMKVQTQLPLEDGKTTCISCHDPHHGNKDRSSFAKSHLRMKENKLCMECHIERAAKSKNHPGECLSCHKVHQGFEHLLVKPQAGLCLQCHTSYSIKHRDLEILEETGVTKTQTLVNKELNCLTCHSAHHDQKQDSLTRDKTGVVEMCQSCHGQRSNTLYQHFHERMKNKNAGGLR